MAKLPSIPVSNRIVLSDDPIYAGRSASILVTNRILPQVLAHLLKKNIFFAVTPYKGGASGVACQMGNAHILAEAVEQAEKRK